MPRPGKRLLETGRGVRIRKQEMSKAGVLTKVVLRVSVHQALVLQIEERNHLDREEGLT